MIKNFLSGLLAISPYFVILFGQIFFANILSVYEIGLFASFSLICGGIFAATSWSGDKYIISQNPLSDSEINKVFSFELFIAIGLFIIYAIFLHNSVYEHLELQNSNLLLIIIALVFCYHPLSRCKALLEKKENFRLAYTPLLISNIVGLIIGYACFLMGLGLWSMIIWKVSSYIIELIILFFLAPSIPKLSFNILPSASFISFAWPMFLGGVVSFVGLNLDYYLVSVYMGPENLGFYWMAFSLSGILLLVRDGIFKILLPVMAMKSSVEDRINLFENFNGAIQIFGVMSAIIVAYFSSFLFSLFLGEQWIESALLFVILYFAAIYKLLAGLSASLLFSSMRTEVALSSSLISILTLGPIIYLAIKFGGLIEIASGVLISTLIVNFIIFETEIRKLCNSGFFHHFSYLSINLVCLYIVSIVLTLTDENFLLNTLGFLVSLLFALVTLPINNVLERTKRFFSF